VDPERDLPIFEFASQREWEEWLETHHGTAKGLWLKMAKKGAGVDSVSYTDAVETALCYGWIDGQKAPQDQLFWLQRFTPRGPRSKWSRINRDKAMDLLRKDRLKPSGRVQVEQAQRDGRWEAAYEGQLRARVPDDLQTALDQHPLALAFFATLDSRNRYAILYRIQDAKRADTRTRRIKQYVTMLEERQTLHPKAR
jgi:uncharacterized protein YdeI (YjbR/CyaY-like superfamily)